MAYVKKAYVLKLMAEKELKYFTLYDSDGRSVIASQESDDCTIKEATNQLEETLESIDGTFVGIKLSGKSKKAKAAGGDVRSAVTNYEFKIRLDETSKGHNTSMEGSYSGMAKMMAEIADLKQQMVAKEKDFQIQLLEKKFEDFKNEQKNSNPYMDLAITQLAGILSKQNGGAPVPKHSKGIAGIEDDTKEQFIKATSAVKRLAKVDKTFGDNLIMLADFAENKNDMYLTYIPTLKALSKT